MERQSPRKTAHGTEKSPTAAPKLVRNKPQAPSTTGRPPTAKSTRGSKSRTRRPTCQAPRPSHRHQPARHVAASPPARTHPSASTRHTARGCAHGRRAGQRHMFAAGREQEAAPASAGPPCRPPPHDTPRPAAETLDPVATHAVARSAGSPPRAATPAKPTRKRGGGVGGVRGRPPNQTRPRVPPLGGARRMRAGSDALQSGLLPCLGPAWRGPLGADVRGRRLPGPTTVGLAPGYFCLGPGHRPSGLFGGPVASVWRASGLLTE